MEGSGEEKKAAAPSSGRRGKTAKGDSNALKRVKKSIAESNFYEALQLIKMLTSRQLSQKHYDEAETTLVTGIEALLAHHQTVAASELGQQLVKLYTDTHKAPTDATIEGLIRHFNGFGPDVDDGRVSFMKAAIKWTIADGGGKHGDPRLHDTLADFYTAKGAYGRAQQHYVRGNYPGKFAAMLVEYARSGEADEADLFITRAVLMYLCLQKQAEAKEVLSSYLAQFSSLKANPTPLINFTHLLLDSFTRSNALHLFSLLRKHYTPSLSRDPEFLQYMDQIGSVYYRLQPRSNAGGFFNDFLKAFLSPEAEGNDASSSQIS